MQFSPSRYYSTEKTNSTDDAAKLNFEKGDGVITATASEHVGENHEACEHDHEGHIIGNINENRTLALIFTCNKCQTRSARKFSHLAYTKGIVIIECGGCGANHLIADNLGWFDKGRNIEEIMMKKGEPVAKATLGSLEEMPDDVKKLLEEADEKRERSRKKREERLEKERQAAKESDIENKDNLS